MILTVKILKSASDFLVGAFLNTLEELGYTPISENTREKISCTRVTTISPLRKKYGWSSTVSSYNYTVPQDWEKVIEVLSSLKEPVPFQPKPGEVFYKIASCGEVVRDTNYDIEFDRRTIASFNAFPTRELAQKIADQQLAMRKLNRVTRELGGRRTVSIRKPNDNSFSVDLQFEFYTEEKRDRARVLMRNEWVKI